MIQPTYQRPIYKPSNLEWIMVQSIDQVENVAVQPSQRAWIMVQNEPVFALRTADVMGLCTTEYYKFERMEFGNKKEEPNYITAEQFTEAINSLKEAINESIVKLAIPATEQPKSSRHKTDDASS